VPNEHRSANNMCERHLSGGTGQLKGRFELCLLHSNEEVEMGFHERLQMHQ
jgi:hypothetical protein